MDIFLLARNFSKQLKIDKSRYLSNKNFTSPSDGTWKDRLEEVDISLLDDDDKKKAFWINVYNGFTNYLIIEKRLKFNMKEDKTFFRDNLLTVGEYQFSLDDIEHGLLRKNARKHLMNNDPRLKLQVNLLDYRIHFALNCGAKSCPAIANYTFSNINEELSLAESVFSEAEFVVNHTKRSIVCSELFVWYKDDFNQVYLNDHQLEGYEVNLTPYDWNI